MSKTIGIDLGTTFSTLAYLDEEGVPVPVANEDGDQELPSLILLVDSGHVVVGPNRMRAAMEEPSHVVERIKRHMGETGDEYQQTFEKKKTVKKRTKIVDKSEEKEIKPVEIDRKYIGKKMSRNEPCFCGSGKKYKRCCGIL